MIAASHVQFLSEVRSPRGITAFPFLLCLTMVVFILCQHLGMIISIQLGGICRSLDYQSKTQTCLANLDVNKTFVTYFQFYHWL